ncbi:hypothetical protein [Lactobacillus helveticus]|uniref:hypothetical protein n=1 Tax=Lactobacillus helveticus TaxID=1587 RepID=UPI001562C86D|nr:hypothetical protein [Lactobacillus helveticus]
MKKTKFAIVFITLITLTAFITFSPRQYSSKASTFSRSHNDKLPFLDENKKSEQQLTELGILLVGLSAYIFVTTFEKTEDKKR